MYVKSIRIRRKENDDWYFVQESQNGVWVNVRIKCNIFETACRSITLQVKGKRRARRLARKYKNSLSLPAGELVKTSLGFIVYKVRNKMFLSFKRALAYDKKDEADHRFDTEYIT